MEELGLAAVRTRIAAAAERVGRAADDVTLVAVSKGRPDVVVEQAYAQGQRVFGENRQQGLAARVDAGLPKGIAWHFIGPLQRRKARYVSSHVALMQSFDRRELIPLWADSTAPVLLQFNLGREPQKGGFDPDEADAVLEETLLAGIDVRGVMAIPPVVERPEDARRWFTNLRVIRDRFLETSPAVATLSMGMTHDFEVAIEEGATMVRVGTAIFGPIHDNTTANG